MVKQRNLLVHVVHVVHIMKCPFKSTAYVCTTSVAIAGVYRYTGVSWTDALFYRKGVQVRCTVHIANAMIVVNQLAHLADDSSNSTPHT